MERLTEKADDGSNIIRCEEDRYVDISYIGYPDGVYFGSVVDRLAAYEDADEQGRLVRLPCKVGDTVYINTPSAATLCEVVDSITKPEFRTRTLEGLRGLDFNFHEFGKSVFLSREEAEKALEGMK